MSKIRGFVLMETIVVITVLSVVLITLYGAYSNILIGVNKKTHYDNTEYIYKANLVRRFLLNLENVQNLKDHASGGYYIYCSDTLTGSDRCRTKTGDGGFEQVLYTQLGVNSIYITAWVPNILESELVSLEATTQKYIKQLDPTNLNAYRIIVMFRSENDDDGSFEYASLKYE